jgi:MoaD family protein
MSITIIIPGSLKEWLGGNEEVACEGKTIGECLDDLDKKCPGFRNRIVDEKGDIRGSVMVFLDGQNLRSLDGLATHVKDGDEVSVIPFAAGG